jgi:hypothetical protein
MARFRPTGPNYPHSRGGAELGWMRMARSRSQSRQGRSKQGNRGLPGALVSKKPLSLPPITAPTLIRFPGRETQRIVYVRPSTSVSPAVGLRKAKVPCGGETPNESGTDWRSWPLLHASVRSRRGQGASRECMGAGGGLEKERQGLSNELRLSCGLRRPQTRQTCSLPSGRRGPTASSAG